MCIELLMYLYHGFEIFLMVVVILTVGVSGARRRDQAGLRSFAREPNARSTTPLSPRESPGATAPSFAPQPWRPRAFSPVLLLRAGREKRGVAPARRSPGLSPFAVISNGCAEESGRDCGQWQSFVGRQHMCTQHSKTRSWWRMKICPLHVSSRSQIQLEGQLNHPRRGY